MARPTNREADAQPTAAEAEELPRSRGPAPERQHHEYCDTRDEVIKGKPCNCKSSLWTTPSDPDMPLPEATVDPTVTAPEIRAAVDAVEWPRGASTSTCECGFPKPCKFHDTTPDMVTAMALLRRMQAEQRTRLFCWFDEDGTYIPPGGAPKPEPVDPVREAALRVVRAKEALRVAKLQRIHDSTVPVQQTEATLAHYIDKLEDALRGDPHA